MSDEDLALLRVLAQSDQPLAAREIAARYYSVSVSEAVATGRSADVAARLRHYSSPRFGALVIKDYPYGVQWCAYALSVAGTASLGLL